MRIPHYGFVCRTPYPFYFIVWVFFLINILLKSQQRLFWPTDARHVYTIDWISWFTTSDCKTDHTLWLQWARVFNQLHWLDREARLAGSRAAGGQSAVTSRRCHETEKTLSQKSRGFIYTSSHGNIRDPRRINKLPERKWPKTRLFIFGLSRAGTSRPKTCK